LEQFGSRREEVKRSGVIEGPFTLISDDPSFSALFLQASRRPPGSTPKITTVRAVALARSSSETMAGLTRYVDGEGIRPHQTLTFYSQLMDRLSPPAATAVIAHELAHAWLNEHSKPEESKAREREADELAMKWGFGPELDALDREADPVDA
jgi:hypothetical protein